MYDTPEKLPNSYDEQVDLGINRLAFAITKLQAATVVTFDLALVRDTHKEIGYWSGYLERTYLTKDPDWEKARRKVSDLEKNVLEWVKPYVNTIDPHEIVRRICSSSDDR